MRAQKERAANAGGEECLIKERRRRASRVQQCPARVKQNVAHHRAAAGGGARVSLGLDAPLVRLLSDRENLQRGSGGFSKCTNRIEDRTTPRLGGDTKSAAEGACTPC